MWSSKMTSTNEDSINSYGNESGMSNERDEILWDDEILASNNNNINQDTLLNTYNKAVEGYSFVCLFFFNDAFFSD